MKCIIQCPTYNSNPRNFEPCANLTIQVILPLKHYHRQILQPFRSIEFSERARSNLKKKFKWWPEVFLPLVLFGTVSNF